MAKEDVPPFEINVPEVWRDKETTLLRQELREAARFSVASQLGKELDEVLTTSHFADDLDADSLDGVELIMGLEEMSGLKIPDEHAQQITTLQTALDYIYTNATPDQVRPALAKAMEEQAKEREKAEAKKAKDAEAAATPAQ